MQRLNLYTEQGGVIVVTQGNSSTTKVKGVFPGATVTVFNSGTVVAASIFGDNLAIPTPKSNPFTSDSVTGLGFFYAANGHYDVQFSGVGFTTFTLGDIELIDIADPTVIGSLTVTGNATVGGTLGVTGAATLSTSATTPALISTSANPASAGQVRLATGDAIKFRNVANGADVQITDAGAAAAGTGNLADLLKWNGGGFQGAAFVDQSAAPANSGVVRTGNNVVAVAARNAVGSGDLPLLQADASNNAQVTPPLRQVEQAAPAGIASSDLIWADSTAHRWKMNNNNGGALTVASTSGDTFTASVFTSPTVNGTPTGTGIPTVTLKNGTGAGNYTTASTSFVRVDATNLAFTVTIPSGWKLLISASGAVSSSTGVGGVNIAMADGSADNTGILIAILAVPATAAAGQFVPWSLTWVINGDGASHTINLQFDTGNAADAALMVNSSATFKPMMTFLLTPSN